MRILNITCSQARPMKGNWYLSACSSPTLGVGPYVIPNKILPGRHIKMLT